MLHSPKNSETHFKIVVVSSKFDNMKLPLQRHRLINSILSQELSSEGTVHALSIIAKTPSQWNDMKKDGEGNVAIDPSPRCRGGDGTFVTNN